MRKKILAVIFKALYITGVLLSSNWTQAQDNSQLNWPIGNSGLGFSKGNKEPSVNNEGVTLAGTGGAAAANDPVSGDLLFYTDGDRVYDASHQVMAGSTPLGGNTNANPSAVISPIPNESGRYVIFTNSAGTINYTVVDMNAGGNASSGAPPLGAVSATATTGITNAADAMIIIKGDTDDEFYLISQIPGTDTYRVFQVSSGGAVQATGEFQLGTPLTAANFSYNAATGKIAVSPVDANVNVQILNFNNTNGDLTFDQEIFNSGYAGTENPAIFDTEWSTDGSKLYISRQGGGQVGGAVLQYNFGDPAAGLQPVFSNSIYRSYGLSTGPDGKIYHLYQASSNGPFLAGEISYPDSVAANVGYNPDPFNGNDFDAKSFPSFAPASRLDYTIGFTTSTMQACQNSEITFFPQVSPMPDSVIWNFGDTISTQYSPVHIFEEAGAYPVTFTAYWGDKDSTITQPINVIAFDVQLNLQDTTVCSIDEFPFEMTAEAQGNTAGLQYSWSTGAQGETAVIDSAGYYWVVASNGTCQTSAGFNAIIYGDTAQYANVWYFGDGAGIDFNKQPPVALTDGVLRAPQGTATMSDRNGDLLFYTDGETVWNKDHQPMLNGNDIGGSPEAAQSSIIVPFPGNETLFYIFTTDDMGEGTYRMTYSIVDIKKADGYGEVISKDNVLFVRSTERITAVGSWLLAHEFGNNTFRAYEVTTEGISSPVLSSEGSTHSSGNPASGESYMKFSPDGTRVAVAVPGTNKVELFDFTDTTGVVEFFVSFDLSEEPYGIEFSPDNSKLFVSTSSAIYQYDVNDTLTVAEVIDRNTTPVTVATGSGFGAIQAGPDGQIYVAINNSPTLGVIQNPNDVPFFDPNGFDLAGKTSLLGLPNFVQNIMNPPMSPTMTADGVCLGTPSNFSATGSSNIDEFFWSISKDLGDSSSVIHQTSDQEFTYLLDSVGTYYVSVNIYNRCGFDTTLVDTLEIIGSPDLSQLPPTAALCDLDLELTTGLTDPGLTFLWSTGETTPTIRVTTPSIYGVTVTNAAGCPSTGEVFVVNGGGPVDLGPDRTICQFDPDVVLDAGNPQSIFVWYEGVGGADPVVMPGETSRILNVTTTINGTFRYIVQVTDPINGCITRDTVTVVINGGPTLTANGVATSGCNASDGSIGYQIGGSGFFTVDLTGPSSFQDNNVSTGAHTIIDLPAGMYDLRVTSNLTGCNTLLPVAVPDGNPGFVINSVVEISECEPDLEVTLDVPANGYNYDLRSTFDPTIPPMQGQATSTGNSFLISDVEPGTYTLTITSSSIPNCVQTYPDAIEVFDPNYVELVVPTVVDGCSPGGTTITASSTNTGVSYSWVGTGITGASDIPTIGVNASGPYTVTASSTDGSCPSTATVEVTLIEGRPVSIVQDGDGCTGSLTLTTDPDTGFSHSWTWNSNTAQTPSIQLNSPGQYDVAVTVRDLASGCQATATYQSTVYAPLSVTLGSELACDNGQPVDLIATANQAVSQIERYIWYDGEGNELAQTIPSVPTYPVDEEGLYLVTVRDINECEASATYNMLRAPFDKGELPPTVSICPPDDDPRFNQAMLDPGGNFVSWDWREVNSNFRETSPSIVVYNGGTYYVTMTNGFGCVDTDTTVVLESCIPRITGPNAFVPGGNNNRFFVFTKYVDLNSFEILIFNRWGEIIYSSNDINFRWDGTYKGKLVPLGTYPYVIRYRSEYPEVGTDEQKEFHGGITVIR